MLHVQIVLTILPPRSYHPLLEMPDFKHKAMSGIEAPGLGTSWHRKHMYRWSMNLCWVVPPSQDASGK